MRRIKPCPACGKPLTIASMKCLWCGQPKTLISGRIIAGLMVCFSLLTGLLVAFRGREAAASLVAAAKPDRGQGKSLEQPEG